MSKKTRIPFEAYRGKEPYIFVSYAHKDSAQVYPQILDLHNALAVEIKKNLHHS